MKKRGQQPNIFRKYQYYKRYFLIDHAAQTVQIHKEAGEDSVSKIIRFQDIQKVFADFGNSKEPNFKKEIKWGFKFVLAAIDRTYYLQAATHEERLLWIHTFSWIIEQCIYKVKMYLKRFKEKTES